MTYDEFLQAWQHALRESRLGHYVRATHTMDLQRLDRAYEAYVEPMSQEEGPFYVTAKLGWTWSALETARGTNEEEVLSHLLGRDEAEMDTDPRWVRVDINLAATLPHGKPVPLPPKARLSEWAEEVGVRLSEIEPVVTKERTRETDDGRLEVLAWRDEQPQLDVLCGPDGTLLLAGVSLHAWQAVDVPRRWDDPDRPQDDDPQEQLLALCNRVRAALHAWTQATDHLLPRADAR